MPYQIVFTKKLEVADESQYINDCCWGGDLVTARLLPKISERYERVQSDQEDWGWFIWFRKGNVSLAIDVFCDDSAKGAFRAHLTARRKRLLMIDQIADGPELEDLKQLVVAELETWTGSACTVTRLDGNYMPPASGTGDGGQ